MSKDYIRTILTAENLAKPEMSEFLGKEVFIRIVEAEVDPWEDLIDHEEEARLKAEMKDVEDIPIEEIRRMTSSIPGSWAQDIINDREERF